MVTIPESRDALGVAIEAPGGIERIRRLILDLAVSGRLTDQLANDDQLPSLMAALGQSRERMIAEGVINRPRHPEGVPVDPAPYEIPSSWKWLRLGDVGAIVGGGTPSSGEARYWADGPGIPWVTPADMRGQESRHVLSGSRDLTPAGLAASSATLLPVGSVLFSSRAPIGHVGIAGQALATNQGFKSCVPYERSMTEYLYLFLRQVAPALDANAFGTTFKEVSGKEVSLVPIPVPPLAEQGRIIIRVQELHALCDRLEEVQRRKNHMRDQFRASAIHALTHAVSDAENVIAWERVDQHWSAISATSDTSAFLLPAVLHLATRGRLAERISSEGTGADVLEGVDLERDDLVRRSEIRQPTPRHIVSPSEMPYTIPEHWQWVRVEDLCTHIVDCLHRTPVYSVKGFPAIRTCDVEPGRVLVDQALLVDRATYEEQITRLAPRAGDVLYSREGGRYGIAAVVPTDVQLCLSQRMMHFRCAAAVVPEYFSWFLNSPLGFGQATLDVGGSASPHVNIRSIRQFVVPLPPTSEQQRIVRRLDQLNSLLASVDSAVEAKELAALGVAEALVASQAVS